MAERPENIDNDSRQLCTSGEDDRLSSLPDNLLITILLLIPFSSAVATSILSHRWRHLWTYLTHISFNFSSSSSVDSFQNFLNSITTTNNVISKLASPKIHTFHLHLPFLDLQEMCSSLLVPTLDEICLRNPEVINIDSSNYCFYSRNLTSSLFKTQSLVELKFDSTFEFDFGADAPFVIDLPNLKILDIILYDSHLILMDTLFKSCPLLEHLCLHLTLEEDHHHVDIIAPNLKFLTIECSAFYFLLIDAPMLVNFKTFGFFGNRCSMSYHFVKNLSCLQEAEISIPEYRVGNENAYLSQILALFQGISCARSLTFDGCFRDNLLDVALPNFLNLVDLSFDGFDLGSNSWMPSCLLRNVKSLKIFSMKPNDNGIRLLQNILADATVLEQLQVSHYRYDDMYGTIKTRVWEEYEFAWKLFKLPMNSSSCQIKLCGDIITTTNVDFGYDQLTCKLQDLTFYSEL